MPVGNTQLTQTQGSNDTSCYLSFDFLSLAQEIIMGHSVGEVHIHYTVVTFYHI